ncbi:MAG: guanylate kinase [Ignavibacteria bacterium]|nr:guanylate kinase [Ignavibacteria bacterium]
MVSAPSGSGKTTIVNEILKNNEDIIFSVSAATRKIRSGEIHGKDYFFMTVGEFKKKIENNEFIEYEKIFDGNYYGTLKKFVDDCVNQGKDVLLDLDVLGALSVKKYYGNQAVLIFIKPPARDVVKQRLLKRKTESPEQIEKRLSRFDIEMAKIKEFNYIILNDNLQDAIDELQKIINKYKNKN